MYVQRGTWIQGGPRISGGFGGLGACASYEVQTGTDPEANAPICAPCYPGMTDYKGDTIAQCGSGSPGGGTASPGPSWSLSTGVDWTKVALIGGVAVLGISLVLGRR